MFLNIKFSEENCAYTTKTEHIERLMIIIWWNEYTHTHTLNSQQYSKMNEAKEKADDIDDEQNISKILCEMYEVNQIV